MTATVEVASLTKRYGQVDAVKGVCFTLEPGEIVALVGHNGAGKTTLLKLLLGLVRPTKGSVRVLGEDPASGQFGARRRLGFLPENVSFNPALTAHEVLSFYVQLKGCAPSIVDELLHRVGLASASSRRVGTYSKGMRQRLGLAQALIGRPEILLLDEPTTGLDPALRFEFYDLIERHREAGTTIVLSSHALAELGDRVDRVIIMNRARMVANGTIQDLREIARLPSKIRCRTEESNATVLLEKLAGHGASRRTNGNTFEIDAAPDRKLELIRLVGDLPVADVDVVPPSLDELYAHFLQTDAPE